jgi:hypothetical protein
LRHSYQFAEIKVKKKKKKEVLQIVAGRQPVCLRENTRVTHAVSSVFVPVHRAHPVHFRSTLSMNMLLTDSKACSSDSYDIAV